jgi:hypothetical protein
MVGITAGVVFAAVGVSWIYADTARNAAELNRSLAGQGNVLQAGSLVGWASGARILPSNPSTVQFEEISSARKLILKYPFEYSGYVLRISQVRQVQYPDPEPGSDKRPAGPPDITLLQVVAKIERLP